MSYGEIHTPALQVTGSEQKHARWWGCTAPHSTRLRARRLFLSSGQPRARSPLRQTAAEDARRRLVLMSVSPAAPARRKGSPGSALHPTSGVRARGFLHGTTEVGSPAPSAHTAASPWAFRPRPSDPCGAACRCLPAPRPGRSPRCPPTPDSAALNPYPGRTKPPPPPGRSPRSPLLPAGRFGRGAPGAAGYRSLRCLHRLHRCQGNAGPPPRDPQEMGGLPVAPPLGT